MKRPYLLSILTLGLAVAACAPARADFSSCVVSLRSEAARQGVSASALDAAFGNLQPDMKVLDFQKDQPEFKTPVWDYLASLVDDERVAEIGRAHV